VARVVATICGKLHRHIDDHDLERYHLGRIDDLLAAWGPVRVLDLFNTSTEPHQEAVFTYYERLRKGQLAYCTARAVGRGDTFAPPERLNGTRRCYSPFAGRRDRVGVLGWSWPLVPLPGVAPTGLPPYRQSHDNETGKANMAFIMAAGFASSRTYVPSSTISSVAGPQPAPAMQQMATRLGYDCLLNRISDGIYESATRLHRRDLERSRRRTEATRQFWALLADLKDQVARIAVMRVRAACADRCVELYSKAS
jgi:hypothetical protein